MRVFNGLLPEGKVYLAAPFFNPAQVGILERLELLFEAAGQEVFNPRKDAGVGVTKKEGQTEQEEYEAWRNLFLADVGGIDQCSWVLAVLDYADVNLYAAPWCLSGDDFIATAELKPVRIPDTGTVWELGNAHAKGKPAVGFFLEERHGLLNLMLSHSLHGMCYGYEQVGQLLSSREMYWSWKGKVQ
jgi:nucleoside 2-deoxyribosyltransferase